MREGNDEPIGSDNQEEGIGRQVSREEDKEKNFLERAKEEAKNFYELSKAYKRGRFSSTDNEAYVIDRKWVRKWKEYVDYTHYKRKAQYSYYASGPYQPKEDEFPGPISNNRIITPMTEFLNDGDVNNPENLVVTNGLELRTDVRLVNKAIWDFFHSLYGGGPCILKKEIEEKSKHSSYVSKVIEVFFRKLTVVFVPLKSRLNEESISKMSPHTVYISRVKSVEEFKQKLSVLYDKNFESLGLKTDSMRLWRLNYKDSIETIQKKLTEEALSDGARENSQIDFGETLTYLEYLDDLTLDDIDLSDKCICVVELSDENNPFNFFLKPIEIRNEKCSWCNQLRKCIHTCVCKKVWYCTMNCKSRDETYHERDCVMKLELLNQALSKPSANSKRGIVGLQNLGNTCFMNTALQGILNCYELAKYFLTDKHKNHINTDNPIGTGGVLVRAYANLLKNVYNGTSSTFSPYEFKRAIGGFQQIFMGFQQHDTMEFLNYLLDGLHEDLNKVLKKPMVEKDDSPNEDNIKANEQWIGFLRRNQSVLVDLLYGQYKSTLYCPNQDCENISKTFDPFLSLTLPIIQSTDSYRVKAFYIPYDINKTPVQLTFMFHTISTIMALRNKVAKVLTVHPMSFIVVRMNDEGDIAQIQATNRLIKNTKEFEFKLFMFQINPEYFYSTENNYYKEDQMNMFRISDEDIKGYVESRILEISPYLAQDYDEDETGTIPEQLCYYSKRQIIASSYSSNTTYEVKKMAVDDNYGFGSDWLKMVIYLNYYNLPNVAKRKRIIFQRIIYINKNWSLKRLHLEIFRTFAGFLADKDEVDELKSDNEKLETYFKKYFSENFSPQIEEDTIKYHEESRYPYRLRIVSICRESSSFACFHCQKKDCHDCLLPFDDEMTVRDLVSKIPKNDEYEIDNNYFFLHPSLQNRIFNRDFAVELTWLDEYKSKVMELNNKADVDFKQPKYEKPTSISLDECFNNFKKIEKLKQGNEWFCPQCKTHQLAKKQMEIYKAPPILILHLKRFTNNSKIDTLVNYPIQDLDLTNYILSGGDVSKKYDLFAVLNHYGGLGGGHYVAYAKNYFNKLWYKFDDSWVEQINEEDVVVNSGYVLLYRRHDIENLNLEEIYNKSFEDYEGLFTKKEEVKEEVHTTTNGTNGANGTNLSSIKNKNKNSIRKDDECEPAPYTKSMDIDDIDDF